MTVGQRIRTARIRIGYTQWRLANAAGSTQANVSLYERDAKVPKPTTFVRLAEALGVPLESLVVGVESEEMQQFRATVHGLLATVKSTVRDGYDPHVRGLAKQVLQGLSRALDLRELGVEGRLVPQPSPAVQSPAEVLRAWCEQNEGDIPAAALAVLTRLQRTESIAECRRLDNHRIVRLMLRYQRKLTAVRAALDGWVCPDGTSLAERVGMLREENAGQRQTIADLQASHETPTITIRWDPEREDSAEARERVATAWLQSMAYSLAVLETEDLREQRDALRSRVAELEAAADAR